MRPGILFLVLALAACGAEQQTTAPGRPAEYSGQITSVEPYRPVTEDCVEPGDRLPDEPVSSDDVPFCSHPDLATLGTVLVEEEPGAQAGDKIYLRIERETVLLGTDGPTDFEDLRVGDTVDVWVDGPVAESYPLQGLAEAIVIAMGPFTPTS